MKNILLAVITAAVSISALATPVSARDRKVWNPSVADAKLALKAGNVVCYGDEKKKMLTDCMIYNPLKGMIVGSTGARAIAGLQKNQHIASTALVGADLNMLTNEDGTPLSYSANVATQENGATLLTQGAFAVLGATMNGAAAGGISAIFGPNCRGGNCGGAQILNINEASAGAVANANLAAALGGNGCATGICPASKP